MTPRRGWTRRAALTSFSVAAVAACGKRPDAPAYEGRIAFAHGVASGDPGEDRIIIWTRVAPERAGPVPVRWVVARNRALSDVVQTGIFETGPQRDYTVKVDVGGLRAGAPYFYGFLAGDQVSTIGKTRTLSRGRMNELKLAVVSCASFPHGFFNVYEAIAQRDDIDLVVHLGDYIYEYGLGGYGGDAAVALGRIPKPEIECVSLDDYRERHRQAKGETELQNAHAICPWIVAWDDHEVANDSWTGGAQNHNADNNEGPWDARKRAALQAYYEYMPIREPGDAGIAGAINRSFQFGDLATLVMLETRLLARTQPFDYARDMPLYATPWDFANPQAPRALSLADRDKPTARMVPVPYRKVGNQLVPIFDWREVSAAIANPVRPPEGIQFVPDRKALSERLDALSRVMLGGQQEEWLAQTLVTSVEAGSVWQVLGSQTLMAPVTAPDLSDTPAQLSAELERLRPGVTQMLGFTRYPIPLNTDSWDGYPKARERVLNIMREAGANGIVVSGDSHAAWASELSDSEGRVAVEFGGTSVTSPGDAEYFTGAGIDFGARVRERNKHIKWTDQVHRGYLVLTLQRAQALAEFVTVSTVRSKDFELARGAAFTVVPGQPGVGPLEVAPEET